MSSRGAALLERLDPEFRGLVLRCGALAGDRGDRAFLVGGSVRDLVLGREVGDFDVVVEGDGLAVAQALSRELHGTLTRHHAFQTATVNVPNGVRIDVATARSEDYQRPGMFPQVVPGSLDDDLQRRDFTFNTMAIGLTGDDAGCFVDPLGGAGDLESGIVRVLHSRSFADDPTRVLRALRFALRFDYDLHPETHDLLVDAVNGGYLSTVSGDRIRRELEYMFKESPREAPVRLQVEGVLHELHAGLLADPMHLQALQDALAWYRRLPATNVLGNDSWALVLACCAASLPGQARWELARRLRLSRRERTALVEGGAAWSQARDDWAHLPEEERHRDSRLEETFRSTAPPALLVAAAVSQHDDPKLSAALRRYLQTLQFVRPLLGGGDLRDMGVPEGPAIGEMLATLRAARLDGEVESAAD